MPQGSSDVRPTNSLYLLPFLPHQLKVSECSSVGSIDKIKATIVYECSIHMVGGNLKDQMY